MSAMQSSNIDVFARDPNYQDIEYRSVAPHFRGQMVQPAFMLGSPLPDALMPHLYGQYDAGPIGVYRVVDGAVSCHGALYHRGIGLLSPSWNLGQGTLALAAEWSDIKDLSAPTRHIEGELVSLVGPGMNVWGHWLVDFLPRLYALHLAGYDILRQRYLVAKNAPRFAIDLLKSLGIEDESLERYDEKTELVSCSALLIPTYLRWGNHFSPLFQAAAAFLLRTITAVAPLPPPPVEAPRLFVSRGAARVPRALVNREEIEALAAWRGFTILDPAAYSIPEQLALFGAARQVVGEYGSGLHNTMFSPGGIDVCALRGTSVHPTFIQSGICQALGQKIGYVLGETPLDAMEQSFSLPLAEINQALDWLDVRIQLAA